MFFSQQFRNKVFKLKYKYDNNFQHLCFVLKNMFLKLHFFIFQQDLINFIYNKRNNNMNI